MTAASGTQAAPVADGAGAGMSLPEAIAELERMDRGPQVRLALAEAEFRIAVAPETEPGEALDRLRRAITHDPFSAKLYLHLGRLLHQAGKHRAALAEYRQAAQLAPSSRRAYLLIAVALLELGKREQALGQALLGALSGGSAADLGAALADLDALIDELSRTPPDGGAAGPAPGRRQRPARSKGSNEAVAADTWRVAVIDTLSQPKPARAQLAAQLAAAAAPADGGGGVGAAEYTVACVLTLAAGEPPAQVRTLAAQAGVEQRADPAATALLDAALELAETTDPARFVAAAADRLQRRLVPAELVCWLHFSRHGPMSGLPVTDAVRLLDGYPAQLRELACFRELRLAVLDGYARQAWAEQRFDEAKLLWRESTPLDPYRVPVAVNLALLSARLRSAPDYESAWGRLAELLYLHAAGAGDVQLFLDERRMLHLALSQQSLHRHCPSPFEPDRPSRDELAAWVADRDALDVWLQEWDLYYLNSRLQFRSPVHLLGVPRDASTELLTEARDALLGYFDRALGRLGWAGVAVFGELARARVEHAYEQVVDQVQRPRDPYHDLEKPRADALADELLRRALLLVRLMRTVVRLESAAHLPLGQSIAARQFSLPRPVLQQLFVARGLLGDGVEIFEMFESDLITLASGWHRPEPAGESGWTQRAAALDGCVEVLPHRLELHVLRCQLLLAAQRQQAAYQAALTALELPPPAKPAESTPGLRRSLVNLVDQVGFREIPAELRRPTDVPTAEAAVTAARRALQAFPRSPSVRKLLAGLLVRLGGEARLREAAELLAVGVKHALDDEQRAEFEDQLLSVRGAAATDAIRQQVKELFQPAMSRVQAAVDGLRGSPGPAAVPAAREVIQQALADVAQAHDLATRAGLTDDASELDSALQRLRRIDQQLDISEE
jgi:tetratricopeptide (TPR) repeat protein